MAAERVSPLWRWASAIRRDIFAVVLAAKDPRVPWIVKLLAVMIAAYALSPLDLIPDFIPLLGQLDELILLPLAIRLIVRLTPAALMAEFRDRAATAPLPGSSRLGAVMVVMMWLGLSLLAVWTVWATIRE